MRRPLRRGGDAWVFRCTRAEQLGVDTALCDAPGGKARGQVAYEGRRPADKEVGIARYFQFAKRADVQMSDSIEIRT